jgi:prolipoprotein diacylglyceryltransferase
MTFHNTSLYELVYLAVLFAALGALVLATWRRGRDVVPGTIVGIFIVYYGVTRWLSDSLRVNDERVAGMTGAQWMCLVMIPAGVWILWKVRPRLAELAGPDATSPDVSTVEGDAADIDTGPADAAPPSRRP